MNSKRKFTMSDFICNICGNKISLPRTRQREKLHIKTFYCPFCKRITDHTEIRYFESMTQINYALKSEAINNIAYIGDDKEVFKRILNNTNKDIFVITSNNKLQRSCNSKKTDVNNYIEHYNKLSVEYLLNNNVKYIIIDEDTKDVDLSVLNDFMLFITYQKHCNHSLMNLQTKQVINYENIQSWV